METALLGDTTRSTYLRVSLVQPMASLLFKAQLIDQAGKSSIQVARILFGVDSPEEKEKTFRLICKSKYPHLAIQEPISIIPAPLD